MYMKTPEGLLTNHFDNPPTRGCEGATAGEKQDKDEGEDTNRRLVAERVDKSVHHGLDRQSSVEQADRGGIGLRGRKAGPRERGRALMQRLLRHQAVGVQRFAEP